MVGDQAHSLLSLVVLTRPIENASEARYFCRFARRTVHDPVDRSFVLTPLSPHLIPRSERRKEELVGSGLTPTITDLTPGVLGPLEGFTDLGYKPFSAFGFNQERHLTWRVNYPRRPSSACPPND